MQKSVLGACLAVLFLFTSALADQVVSVAPLKEGESKDSMLDRAFDQALALEVDDILGAALPISRKEKIMAVLVPQRSTLVRGYSETGKAEKTPLSGDGNESAESPATWTVKVRVQREDLRARLREMGVLATIRAPLPYVLVLEDVDSSRTARLAFLQELSGLQPVGAGGEETPVLRLTQFGDWTGTLSLGPWSASHTARKLDDVWLVVWKSYFTRPGSLRQEDLGLGVRISGWVSSDGPMEFDRLLEGWSAEIDQKTLTGVEMRGPGMAGVWRIRPKSKDAFLLRLNDAAKAQGLELEIF